MQSHMPASQESRCKPVIGLVGGIGAGKSTVARMLESLGCGVIDADALAQAALEQLQVKQRLRQWWGNEIIDATGGIDRAAVGRIVFDDPVALARLECLLHPKVLEGRQELHRRYQAQPTIRVIVEDCPLLLEKGLDSGCDVLILVRADWPSRSRRVKASRGWSAQDLARREKMQISLDTKADRADYVIDNDLGKADCLEQVRHVLSQILQHDSEPNT